MPKSRGSLDLGGLYLPMINRDRPITGFRFGGSQTAGVSQSWGECLCFCSNLGVQNVLTSNLFNLFVVFMYRFV